MICQIFKTFIIAPLSRTVLAGASRKFDLQGRFPDFDNRGTEAFFAGGSSVTGQKEAETRPPLRDPSSRITTGAGYQDPGLN